MRVLTRSIAGPVAVVKFVSATVPVFRMESAGEVALTDLKPHDREGYLAVRKMADEDGLRLGPRRIFARVIGGVRR